MRDTTDPELVARYAEMAAGGANLRGMSTLVHEEAIGELIRKTGARTILDYGCGAGDQYRVARLHERWGVGLPWLYDPAFPELAAKPAPELFRFDGVICNDVLEHVDELHVGALIAELFDYAERFVFASVCCREAKKIWPDGTNLHVCVRPMLWWRKRFEKARRKGVRLVLVESP